LVTLIYLSLKERVIHEYTVLLISYKRTRDATFKHKEVQLKVLKIE